MDCGPHDFQFLKRSGHVFRVPDVAPGFTYDFSALKILIGQGDLYLGLVVDCEAGDGEPGPPGSEPSNNKPSDSESALGEPSSGVQLLFQLMLS